MPRRDGLKRSKPTSVRMWPDDEAWVREQARRRRVPLNLVIDEAITVLRQKVESETSTAAISEALESI